MGDSGSEKWAQYWKAVKDTDYLKDLEGKFDTDPGFDEAPF